MTLLPCAACSGSESLARPDVSLQAAMLCGGADRQFERAEQIN